MKPIWNGSGSGGAQYLVGTPKGLLRKFEKPLLEKDWREVEAGIEVKLCALADGSSTDTFILCRSRARIEKEKAILERFLVRVEAGLAKIAQALEQGTLKDSGKAERRIGRLLSKNTRAERHFKVEMKSTEAGPRQPGSAEPSRTSGTNTARAATCCAPT